METYEKFWSKVSIGVDFYLLGRIDLTTWTGYTGDMGKKGETFYDLWNNEIDGKSRSNWRVDDFSDLSRFRAS